MIRWMLLTLIATLLVSVSAQIPYRFEARSALEVANLHGAVRTLRIEAYSPSDSSLRQPRRYVTFSKDGSLLSETIYDERTLERYEIVYDAAGRALELASYSASGSLRSVENYAYDAQGRPTHSTFFYAWSGDAPYVRLLYTYEASGAYTVTSFYGSGAEEGVTTYDAQGEAVQYLSANGVSGWQSRYERRETEDGWLLYSESHGLPAMVVSIRTKHYDHAGRLLAESGSSYRWVYSYNPRGDLIESEYRDSQNLRRSITRYAYDYDRRGNWIKRSESHFEGQLHDPYPLPTTPFAEVEVLLRDITYH